MTAAEHHRRRDLSSRPYSYDGALGQRIISIHRWAVDQGLQGASTAAVFSGLCQQLAEAGVPLWRGFAGVQTLHPQWGGYSMTWRREDDRVVPVRRERGAEYDRDLQESPFALLMPNGRIAPRSAGWPSLRRRLIGPERQLDFPVLEGLTAAGGTDYFAQIVRFGPPGDPSYGNGIGYSFTTDRAGGFADGDLLLIEAVLPAASLAIMGDAGHGIASGLLAAYLGDDAGRRVHAGAVERGSVESIRAVLWFADIRGFTGIADTCPGLAVVDLVNEVFEALAAPLRAAGGQVLKFLGDGLLAIFPSGHDQADTCRRALDAAIVAMSAVDRLRAARSGSGRPAPAVDLALHLGEVLYGNVGAVGRLDFTVIGPAVNEVVRIETLCQALGRNLLVSAEFATAFGDHRHLVPLGCHVLRGVQEPREIFGLDLGLA